MNERLKKESISIDVLRSDKALFELFFLLTPASSLAGAYRPGFPGPKWRRPIKQWGLSLLGLPGWQGKQFFQDEAVNIITVDKRAVAGTKMNIRTRPHRLDGQAGLVATYPEGSHFLWRHCTDEFRMLNDDTVIGMAHFDFPLIRHKPMMFVLYRDIRHQGGKLDGIAPSHSKSKQFVRSDRAGIV